MLPLDVSVRGSLKTMAIADVLDWIDRRELKGQLALKRGNVTRKLQLAWGCATGASSDNPAEYLGQLLINAGVIDEGHLRAAYDQRAAGGSLGRTLLDMQLVTEDALREALEVKIRESVADALSWSEGSFIFDPDEGPKHEAGLYEIALPLRDLMIAGHERAEQWKILRALVPTDEQRFWLPDPAAVESIDPASSEGKLLRCVARNMTVREIVLDQHSLTFPIVDRLAALLRDGTIRLDRRTKPRAPGGTVAHDPEQLLEAARGRSAGGDRYGALALARQALEAAPGDEDVRRTYQEVERALFAELSRTLLGKYRVPKLVKQAGELAALELSPEEKYFIGRIDGRWDLLSLMRVSPLREVEALITLQRLAQRGVITLDEK
jgi:hypothetical protein